MVACCILLLLVACGRTPDRNGQAPAAAGIIAASGGKPGWSNSALALPQGVYIWQRVWTRSHRGVLADSHDLFSELRVLAAQLQPGEGWFDAHVDLDALRIDGRVVRPVIRLDGRLHALDSKDIATRIDGTIAAWREAGVRVDGIEIDFDCPSARLQEYAHLLDALKSGLPRDVAAWIGAPGLPTVLARTDEAVLQVHAVSDPAQGLFDANRAAQWIEQFGALTRKPFRVALPAYGSALVLNADGVAVGVESEAPLAQAGERRELNADPLAVAKLLRDLERAHPATLRGVLWFRLPLPGDRRAWPLATLGAVIHAQPLQAELVANARASGNGAFDLQVANRGTLEAELPARVEIAARGCGDADALPGYRIERERAAGLRFVRETSATLPASQTRMLGWVRCPHLSDEELHVLR
jgi:hypothetical protein